MRDNEKMKELLTSANVAGGTTNEAIAAAETQLGVHFPPSYRAFLSQFGAALCKGFEIAGLFEIDNDNEPPLWSHVTASTLQIRKVSRGLIPDKYVFISDDGGDYKFYLDTSCPDPQGECPVVALGPGADALVVAADFHDFIDKFFHGRLAF